MVGDKTRRINSIEFFKKGIEPRWEDPKNENGGRLVFQVAKSDKSNEIYTNLVYYLIGEQFDMSERLNGFRFISSKSPSTVSFRAEIWFDFNNDDTDTLEKYKDIFEKIFNEVGYEYSTKAVKFINMKGDEKKESKKEDGEGGKWRNRQVPFNINFLILFIDLLSQQIAHFFQCQGVKCIRIISG